MQDTVRYCYNCMERLSFDDRCPHCGTRNEEVHNEFNQLPPGTVIGNKYILGKALGQGGFGITYIGVHPNLRKVAVKEYYPGYIAFRDEKTVFPFQTKTHSKSV